MMLLRFIYLFLVMLSPLNAVLEATSELSLSGTSHVAGSDLANLLTHLGGIQQLYALNDNRDLNNKVYSRELQKHYHKISDILGVAINNRNDVEKIMTKFLSDQTSEMSRRASNAPENAYFVRIVNILISMGFVFTVIGVLFARKELFLVSDISYMQILALGFLSVCILIVAEFFCDIETRPYVAMLGGAVLTRAYCSGISFFIGPGKRGPSLIIGADILRLSLPLLAILIILAIHFDSKSIGYLAVMCTLVMGFQFHSRQQRADSIDTIIITDSLAITLDSVLVIYLFYAITLRPNIEMSSIYSTLDNYVAIFSPAILFLCTAGLNLIFLIRLWRYLWSTQSFPKYLAVVGIVLSILCVMPVSISLLYDQESEWPFYSFAVAIIAAFFIYRHRVVPFFSKTTRVVLLFMVSLSFIIIAAVYCNYHTQSYVASLGSFCIGATYIYALSSFHVSYSLFDRGLWKVWCPLFGIWAPLAVYFRSTLIGFSTVLAFQLLEFEVVMRSGLLDDSSHGNIAPSILLSSALSWMGYLCLLFSRRSPHAHYNVALDAEFKLIFEPGFVILVYLLMCGSLSVLSSYFYWNGENGPARTHTTYMQYSLVTLFVSAWSVELSKSHVALIPSRFIIALSLLAFTLEKWFVLIPWGESRRPFAILGAGLLLFMCSVYAKNHIEYFSPSV